MTDTDLSAAALPLLATRNLVVLPGSRATVEVVRPASVAVLAALQGGLEPRVGLFQQREVDVETPGDADLATIGVEVRVLGVQQHGDIGFTVDVEAVGRLRRGALLEGEDYLTATVEPLEDADDPELRERATALAHHAAQHFTEADAELTPGGVADRVGASTGAGAARMAEVLDALDVGERLELTRRMFDARTELEGRIGSLALDLAELWVLEDGAEQEIERRLSAGEITPEEAADLRHYAEHGYVLWEQLIDEADVDALNADVVSIAELPGRFVSTDYRRGRPTRLTGRDFDHFESIYDLYVNFESSRRVCFHPKVRRFLELLFGTRAVAIQQLLFQRSNGHPLHQDSAYVCTREPLLVAATWIALEDVVEGRGELTYFDGSHRIPHLLYADGSKRINPEADDAEATRAELLRRAEALGCEQRSLIARKGDVFLWAADLLHGSNPRTRSEEETRRSCVTHYCPETTEPLWAWLYEGHEHAQETAEGGLITSAYYRLPHGGGDEPARPVLKTQEPC